MKKGYYIGCTKNLYMESGSHSGEICFKAEGVYKIIDIDDTSEVEIIGVKLIDEMGEEHTVTSGKWLRYFEELPEAPESICVLCGQSFTRSAEKIEKGEPDVWYCDECLNEML